MRNSPRAPRFNPRRLALWVVLPLLLALAPVGLAVPGVTSASAVSTAPALTMTSRSRSAFALSWTTVDGASTYQVRYSTRSTMKKSKSRIVTGTSVELTGLKYHKGYYVQVRARDAAGSALTGYSKPTKLWTLSKSKFRILPPSGLTAAPLGSTSLTVSFTPRAGAAKYLVRYSRTSSFKITDRQTVATSSLILPGLESSTVYYLDVRALSSSGKPLSYFSDNFTKSPLKVTTGPAYSSSVAADSLPKSLRVASYNIKCAGCESGSELGWTKRRQPVAQAILDQHPDVIGVQEASQANLPGNTLNQYDDLVAMLGDPYRLTNAYRYNCETSTSSNDCTYLYRGASQSVRIIYNAQTLRLLDSGSRKLAHVSTKDNDRYLAWAKFRQVSTGAVFYFGTTHLQPNPGGTSDTYLKDYYNLRKEQADQIREKLESIAGSSPAILTGDMNSRYNSPVPSGVDPNPQYTLLTRAGFHDPLNGGTRTDRQNGPDGSITSLKHLQYNSCNTYSRTPPKSVPQGNNIDYIYLKGGITATAWETVVKLDTSGDFADVIPSDHNLIRADVTLP